MIIKSKVYFVKPIIERVNGTVAEIQLVNMKS